MSKCLYSAAKVIWLASLGLVMLVDSPGYFCAQFGGGHKPKAEIARMTPEQRVEEYCREYARHSYSDSDYLDLLGHYIDRDGLKALPGLVKIVDDYDPTRSKSNSKENDARCFAAEGLLSQIDGGAIRLRGIEEGGRAIVAIRRLIERMRAAHFDTAESYAYEQNRYQGSLSHLEHLEGINYYDEAIGNTLRLKYEITLSDKELLGFVNYMISQDPRYPSWSEGEEYKDLTKRNEAGYPIWYFVVKAPEPFYKAYLNYKAKPRKPADSQ